MTSTHDAALRQALEQQAAALSPVAARLHVAVVHPPVAPVDWHGPASDAYAGLEAGMRSRIAAAEDAVTATLRSTNAALGEFDG